MVSEDKFDELFKYCPQPVKERYLSFPDLKRHYQALLEGEFEYVALDFETTGLDPEADAVIEVAALKVKGGEVQDRLSSLLNPKAPIPPIIRSLTGIDDSMVEGSPSLEEFFPTLRDFIGGLPVVAHSELEKSFLNRAFLEYTGESFNNPYIDTLDLGVMLLPFLKSHRLSDLSLIWGIGGGVEHRARPDTERLVKVFEILQNALYNMPIPFVATLASHAKEQSGLAFFLNRVLAEQPSGKRTRLVDLSELIRPDYKLLKASPLIPLAEEPWIDESEIFDFFSKDGLLAQVVEDYEERDEQVKMALAVREAILNDKFLLVEAGTGTGKSLAYLFPSALWAVSAGERVVVSTKTLNLQDQLYTKDLPLISEALRTGEFRYSILKGYSNYVCPRKIQNIINGKLTFEDKQVAILGMLLNWLADGGNGDVSLLNVSYLRGLDFYILADYRDCSQEGCLYAKKGLCPYRNALERAKLSHIVVVNHSLLLTGAGIQFRKLVIDEAHTLEDVATEQFGIRFSYDEAKRFLRFIHQPFGGDGFLGELEDRIKSLIDDTSFKKAVRFIKRAELVAESCHVLLEDFFVMLSKFSNVDEEETEEIRFSPQRINRADFAGLLSAGDELCIALEELAEVLSNLLSLLSGQKELAPDLEFVLQDLEGKIGHTAEMKENLETILHSEDENFALWAVVSGSLGIEKQSIQRSPINVGPSLRALLYDNLDTICMTSATLAIGDSFEFFSKRCGLDLIEKDRVKKLVLGSSFDFHEQMEILTVGDMPAPGSPDYEGKLAEVIEKVLLASEGGALVLFTNKKLMVDTYKAIEADVYKAGISLLCQMPRYSRRRLTEEFIDNPKASLFGAASFWEGVDAKGDTLRLVILTRIPFESPGRAVFEARCEKLKSEGRNDFMELSLPLAALRLKQGVGRLIRTKNDKGQVLILDSRVENKSYGKLLLNSLPGGKLREVSLRELTEAIAEFKERS